MTFEEREQISEIMINTFSKNLSILGWCVFLVSIRLLFELISAINTILFSF